MDEVFVISRIIKVEVSVISRAESQGTENSENKPGAYIFQRPFLRGLFLVALIFRKAYVWREICVSKSIGPAYNWKEMYHFCFVLLCIWAAIYKYQRPQGAYIRRGDVTEVFFFALSLGGLYLEGLIQGGAYFRNFMVSQKPNPIKKKIDSEYNV